MSDYQDIRGTRVKFLTSDPTLESSYEGQIWYNSSTGVNKAVVVLIEAFSSLWIHGNGRQQSGNFGIQTATADCHTGWLYNNKSYKHRRI